MNASFIFKELYENISKLLTNVSFLLGTTSWNISQLGEQQQCTNYHLVPHLEECSLGGVVLVLL
jgi:hypothetical protein